MEKNRFRRKAVFRADAATPRGAAFSPAHSVGHRFPTPALPGSGSRGCPAGAPAPPRTLRGEAPPPAPFPIELFDRLRLRSAPCRNRRICGKRPLFSPLPYPRAIVGAAAGRGQGRMRPARARDRPRRPRGLFRCKTGGRAARFSPTPPLHFLERQAKSKSCSRLSCCWGRPADAG